MATQTLRLLLALLTVLVIIRTADAEARQQLWKQSTHECFVNGSSLPPPAHPSRWCLVTNLYLWQGRAIYLSADHGKGPSIAEVPLDVVEPEAFAAMLPPDVGVQQMEEAYLWGGVPKINKCDKPYANFGHTMMEGFVTLHMFLCEVLGRCSYADRRGFHLIDIKARAPCNEQGTYPAFFHEALACLADHPLRHINSSALRDRVVVVGRAWLGKGQRCRKFNDKCRNATLGNLPPTLELMAAWRNRMSQCLGVPTTLPAPLTPAKLLVVDRPYEAGRHLNNIDSIMRAVQQRYNPVAVHIDLRYMEGLTLREQAALWSLQTVVLHVHGSAQANWLFMPLNSVAVKLSILPLEEKIYSDFLFGQSAADDFRGANNLSWLQPTNSEFARLHPNTMSDRELFDGLMQKLTWEERLMMLLGNCSAVREEFHLDCVYRSMYRMNAAYDVDAVLSSLDQALQLAYAKQGRQPPPDLLLPPGAAAAQGVGTGAGGGGRHSLALSAALVLCGALLLYRVCRRRPTAGYWGL